ncbi:MAG: RelA/SpoT family protein [Ancylobacter novellus]|uniref:RelA/SpoT family protein n=1 Tax=Ancylobacter novellus TaxID=921 RepID=A0A2W5KB99_ANCNO|nr:MAG: RelA/SpoT family protein [Ancylobacter novellus]
MTRDAEFIERWSSEKSFYLAWGDLISTTVKERLVQIIAPTPPDYFLRTPVLPRLKGDQKLIEKAYYRNKNYQDPYDDITDKVGTRFVVLLGRDVRLVEDTLRSIEGWTFSKDRDYEEEQKENPEQFAYAAVHYVVRPGADTKFREFSIPASTPCEVQIKTLLQHAYSELTHDTIYKPQIKATHAMQRNAAKAMALLEATNDYFEKVADDVDGALSSVKDMTARLTAIYRSFVGIDAKPSVLEGLLLAAYEGDSQPLTDDQINDYLGSHAYLAENIRHHVSEQNPIFSQPSVLLVYYLAAKSVRRALAAWPLTPAEMEPLLVDIGESIY